MVSVETAVRKSDTTEAPCCHHPLLTSDDSSCQQDILILNAVSSGVERGGPLITYHSLAGSLLVKLNSRCASHTYHSPFLGDLLSSNLGPDTPASER